MMHIPPPPPLPTIPKPPLFPNARKMQTEKQLGDDIRDLCSRLAKSTILPGWQDVLWKFRGAVAPNGVCDNSRLPIPASAPNSSKPQPIACLYARLAWVIRCYWQLCVHGTEDEAHIRQYLNDIEPLLNGDRLEVALDRCDVVGDERTGYWIEPK